MDDLVSIIIPTFNGSKTINRAVNSALNQTYKNIEIIIVDDMSTDNTREIISKLNDRRIRIFQLDKKANASFARNLGISKANGEYIAFLDDDDEWSNLKISNQVEFLNKNKEHKAVITDYCFKTEENIEYFDTSSSDYSKDILLMNVKTAAGSNMLVLRSEVEAVNGFDTQFVGHQDLEFFIRIDQRNKVCHMKGYLVTIHGRSGRGATNTDKLLRVKGIFLSKFSELINKYPKRLRNKIYARHWLQVSKGYALENKIELSKFYLRKSLNYTFLFSNKWKILPMESYFPILLSYIKNAVFRKSK